MGTIIPYNSQLRRWRRWQKRNWILILLILLYEQFLTIYYIFVNFSLFRSRKYTKYENIYRDTSATADRTNILLMVSAFLTISSRLDGV